MLHIVGFQVLKYYFYVSVSFAGSVFSLAKLGRLFVSDDYVELFDGLCSFCVLREARSPLDLPDIFTLTGKRFFLSFRHFFFVILPSMTGSLFSLLRINEL